MDLPFYTRNNARVVTDLQTSCDKSVHEMLATSCVRTACSQLLEQVCEQLFSNNLEPLDETTLQGGFRAEIFHAR